MAMTNAGRILILPRGAWDNLTVYDMLDLVTQGTTAYLARQSSVGVDPSTDTTLTYWQPFGSAASIASTTTPGIVMPDGTTILVDSRGQISVPKATASSLGIVIPDGDTTIVDTNGAIKVNAKIDSLRNVNITNAQDGQILVYNGTSQEYENRDPEAGGGSFVTITTDEPSLFNQTVTLSDGTTTLVNTFDASGVALFTGVTMIGTLTAQASDGSQTATTTVDISYFSNYSASMAFFRAPITITTTSTDLYGALITVTKDSAVIGTTTFSSVGQANYNASGLGTYTFSVTSSGVTYDASVTVMAETSYTVVLNSWNALVNITTDESQLFSKVIDVTKDGASVGSTVFDNTGHAAFNVHEAGTYVFTVNY